MPIGSLMIAMRIELLMTDVYRIADEGDVHSISDDKAIHWNDYNKMSIGLLMTDMSI